MDVRIRQLTDLAATAHLCEDLDAYLVQATDEFRDSPPAPGVGRALLERVFAAEEGLVLVAMDREGTRRLGLCVTAPFVDPWIGDALPVVAVLYVHPEFRHRGLARQLVEAASDTLAMRGKPRLGAIAGHNDDALISMGERWGFVRHWELMLRE